MHYAETEYGFEYGAAKVTRIHADERKGWVIISLQTPRHGGADDMQIYVTKTGKVRIHDSRGEWTAPKEA